MKDKLYISNIFLVYFLIVFYKFYVIPKNAKTIYTKRILVTWILAYMPFPNLDTGLSDYTNSGFVWVRYINFSLIFIHVLNFWPFLILCSKIYDNYICWDRNVPFFFLNSRPRKIFNSLKSDPWNLFIIKSPNLERRSIHKPMRYFKSFRRKLLT